MRVFVEASVFSEDSTTLFHFGPLTNLSHSTSARCCVFEQNALY